MTDHPTPDPDRETPGVSDDVADAVPAEHASDDPPVPPPGIHLTGHAIGIDVGGTGVKGGVVDLATGRLASDRVREDTPHPATPEDVLATIGSVTRSLKEANPDARSLPIGCCLPGVVKQGRLVTAANIDKRWLEVSATEMLSTGLGTDVLVLNDADAAGIAEMTYGAGRGVSGTVVLLTIGTGIGSALFLDGRLVPNTELGHVTLRGKDAETLVSGAARDRRSIGWKKWAREFNDYLALLDAYLWPDLFILGGGVSKEMAKFGKWLDARPPVVAATLLNTAGIAGAALAAASAHQGRTAAQG